MTKNDMLRRLRYTLNYNDAQMAEVFGQAGFSVTEEQVKFWLKKPEEEEFQKLDDKCLALFLNGLINQKRGKKEGTQFKTETELTNNTIFIKLKIAYNLKADDVMDILQLAEFQMSKHELSALFRKPGHKHFRLCQDQALRKFFKGLQLKYRA